MRTASTTIETADDEDAPLLIEDGDGVGPPRLETPGPPMFEREGPPRAVGWDAPGSPRAVPASGSAVFPSVGWMVVVGVEHLGLSPESR